MREQHRIEQMLAWPFVQKELALILQKARQYKRWSGFFREFIDTFWPVLCGLSFGILQMVREGCKETPGDSLADLEILGYSCAGYQISIRNR